MDQIVSDTNASTKMGSAGGGGGSDNKKREDLTSLGSDDSGIICGSEPDQTVITRIRRSHESIDSGDIEAEEECIEMLDTTSMDEDYRMLQSDLLCFYQSSEDDTATVREKQKPNRSLEVADKTKTGSSHFNDDMIRYRDQSMSIASAIMEKRGQTICVPINFEEDGSVQAPMTPTVEAAAAVPPPLAAASAVKQENIKNEVIFKSLFGATKNAIFRTAQSIIDNHEKKNSTKKQTDQIVGAVAAAATNPQTGGTATSPQSLTTATATTPIEPDQIKSPTELSKKKEFFTLKPSSYCSKNKVAAATTPDPAPTIDAKLPAIVKSTSTLSLSLAARSDKGKVPGIVKCLIRMDGPVAAPDNGAPISVPSGHQTKLEKGPNGLLRFFESPIFNIHFALHYLFYSKEPGVLSFIGNKIFSFKDHDVDLYIPQLILMYMQMDELAEVLDPYLVYRCRRSADFALKCSWLLEAYNFSAESFSHNSSGNVGKKTHLTLMKELYPRRERRELRASESFRQEPLVVSPIKKTHHR